MSSMNSAIPSSCKSAIQEVAEHYFHSAAENLEISILHGGYSHTNTCLLLKVYNKEYVFRVKKAGAPLEDLQRELYAVRTTAVLKIAPAILYVTADLLGVLMEYVPTHTLSMKQSRNPENIKIIADALRAAHSIAQNPHYEKSGIESVVEAYNAIKDIPAIQPLVSEAMQLVYAYDRLLEQCNGNKANIHGDLNSRNILLHNQRIYIIDWDYVSWEDPFMDISYLAMRLDYTHQQEMMLLEYYLEHTPTSQDIERYYHSKQLNYAELAVYFFYFAIQNKKEGCNWDLITPVKPWSEYANAFVDQYENVIDVSQYFYDQARCLLNKAVKY